MTAQLSPSFFPILKRVALRRDAKATSAIQADVQKSLQFFNLDSEQITAMGSPPWLASATLPTPKEFEELMQMPIPDLRLTLHSSIKPIVTQLLAVGNLSLRYPEVLTRQKAKHIYRLVEHAINTVPGQSQIATAIAADLALQLSAPNPQKSSRLLIHGDKAWGGAEILQSISSALAQQEGYKVLDIDCSAYRSEGEAASWDGTKAYWSGSAPGEITSFIHKHPKAVIVFHHLDETLPKVMAALRPALLTGEMVDHHGLEAPDEFASAIRSNPDGTNKRRYQPTTVNCRQALFLASAAHGTDWLTHPDASAILGDTTAQQNANLFQALVQATREHRGEATPLFDVTVLGQLADHHHVVKPLAWPVLQAQAQNAMAAAQRHATQTLGMTIRWANANTAHDLATLLLCHHGNSMALAHTTPEAISRALFKPFQARNLATPNSPKVVNSLTIGFEKSALQDWASIQQQLGADPMATLRRKNQFVDFSLKIERTGAGHTCASQVKSVALKSTRRLSDYTGASGLVSHIPHDTLADVAGQSKAKAFLAEIVGYLHNPRSLAAYGIDMPRGVVLHGPPGTGKTLLARALAGQAQLPFITITGSELLNPDLMSRVYKVAHRAEPCIIHIDEADVLGKRGQHSHAHDVALNLLLSKIDGFERHSGIFHVLTTNRPAELDPALTRPGRIDRMFEIGPLELDGRQACLKNLWPLLDLQDSSKDSAQERILKLTYGMTGAELAQLHREVALRLVRQSGPGQQDPAQRNADARAPLAWVLEEINRIQYGEAHERHASEAFRHRVAVHEAGHALLHHLLWPEHPIAQLSITPRNGAAGFLAVSNEGNAKVNETPAAIRAYITVLLGGRAAEIMVFGADGPSSGASSDLARATEAAWKAVAFAGLDAEFGAASLAGLMHDGKMPERLHHAAAKRAMQWVEQAGRGALRSLHTHRDGLDALVKALLTHETLDGPEVTQIITPHLNH